MRLSICLLFAISLHAQPTPEAEVRQLMGKFLTAFDNLDWPAFRQCWADDPVVFFPSLVEPTGRRTENAATFEGDWHRQFDLIREGAATAVSRRLPFSELNPRTYGLISQPHRLRWLRSIWVPEETVWGAGCSSSPEPTQVGRLHTFTPRISP